MLRLDLHACWGTWMPKCAHPPILMRSYSKTFEWRIANPLDSSIATNLVSAMLTQFIKWAAVSCADFPYPAIFTSRKFVDWAEIIIIQWVSSRRCSNNVAINGMDELRIIVFTCMTLVPIIEISLSWTSLMLSTTMVTHSMSILTDKLVVSNTSIHAFRHKRTVTWSTLPI